MISIEGPESVDHETLFELVKFFGLDTMFTVVITLACII